MGRIFGTDGARGVAITELSCERAMEIGRAAAAALGSGKACPRILVGRDTRVSSEALECALAAGICSVGAQAELLGVVPTPAVAYLVRRYGADAGVMISASHNPAEYNGIKLFSGEGYKLPDSVESEVEELILDRPENIRLCGGEKVGRIVRRENAAEEYIDYIRCCADTDLSGMAIALDCANGSASATAERLFSTLGAKCALLSDKPDGLNINVGCGSTHIERLRGYVRENGLCAGFAFDGDADRCLAVDEKGNVVDGDRIIAVLARYMKEKGRLRENTAVVTVMSNLGLCRSLSAEGIRTVAAKVGDRYVLEEMQRGGYNIGGEQSGHIILSDYATTGDGQLTAAMLARVMRETGKPLSQLAAGLSDYPQALLNVKIPRESRGKWQSEPAIAGVIREAANELGDNGRVLVRESGTEPLIRILTEGKDEGLTKRLSEKIAEVIKAALC